MRAKLNTTCACVVLALAARLAIRGMGLAVWLTWLSSQIKLPVAVPVRFDRAIDWHALVFTFALALVCGIGFGLAPALQATKADVASTLKEGATAQLRGYRRFGMRNLLVVFQVAGSLMLLLITGFLVIGITRTGSAQTAFDPNTMYLLSIDPVRDGYSAEKAQALFEKLPERIKSLAPVRSVALADQPPFSIVGGASALTTAWGQNNPAQTLRSVAEDTIGAGYFASLSEPVLEGREFDERDERLDSAAKGVALPMILNETAARGLFGRANPIGQPVTENDRAYNVIGVVHDLKSGVVTGQSPAMMYLPLTRRDFAHPPAGGMTIMVRSDAGADALEAIRRQIASMDPNLAVFNVRTLGDYLDISKSYMRIAIDMYGAIGAFGLILAAIGLAGVTAYAVARRRKEIEIRMALGARKGQVLRLVLREGTALVAVGTLVGFAGAMAMAKALSALTNIFVDAFHVGTNDPRLLIGAPLLLAALAMIACYVPARRSTQIDPLIALREE